MKLIQTLIFGLFLTLNTIPAKADDSNTDEQTLRNQLFADVFLLQEGVDHLQISMEVLNKRYKNQMNILKGLQTKFLINDSDEEDGMCDIITGLFNSTFRKYNAFESRIVSKLDEIQDNQSKLNLNRNCGPKSDSSADVSLMSKTLSDVSEKIDKCVKLETFEAKLNLQQTKLDKFMENQLKVLQQINEKLSKNDQQFDEDLKNKEQPPNPPRPNISSEEYY